MQLRELGTTGEQISALGLGCMGMVGWYGTRDDTEARATLHRALELGVNYLDTAAVYQDGENEKFVGAAIADRRDQVFLATKCGFVRSADGSSTIDNNPQAVKQSCEDSLQRLGIDEIDLFYLHRIDPRVPIEESVGAMADLVAAGKIRYLGLSEAGAESVRRAHATHPIAVLQNEYSLWTRDPEDGILTVCRELGISLVAYSPLGRAFLTGAITGLQDLPADDNRHRHPRFQDDNAPHNLEFVERVRQLADARNCTPAQLAIAWVMAQGEDILPIPGTKKRKYLADNVGAVDVRLSTDDLREIANTLPRDAVHGERYPPQMMEKVNR